MKKSIVTGIAILVFIIPGISFAQTCSSPIVLSPLNSDANNVLLIRNALADYTSHLVAGKYELCFDMDELEASQAEFVSTLVLTTKVGETAEVYIVGLKIKSDPAEPISSTVLQVNNQGNAGVILKDLEFNDISNGIQLLGNAGIRLIDSTIDGDDAKSGNCVDIQAADAEIEGVNSEVEIKSCNNGVYVQASNAKIKNARIWDNKVGVWIATGITGTDIESTRIYANDDGNPATLKRTDGIRIEDGLSNEPTFFEILDEVAKPVPDGESVITYEDEIPYIYIDIPPGKEGRIEFYYSDAGDCVLDPGVYALGQACSLMMDAGVHMKRVLDGAQLDEGPVYYEIAPEHLNKTITSIFVDPDLGTSGITRQFSLSSTGADHQVAFVSNPYDIPTTGGATEAELASGSEEEGESGNESGNGAGGGEMSGEGSGATITSAAGCGGGGSSLANNSFRDVVFSFNVWWVLLILAIAGGVHMATVRIRDRHRDR
jgi:hypothetical protein